MHCQQSFIVIEWQVVRRGNHNLLFFTVKHCFWRLFLFGAIYGINENCQNMGREVQF